MENEKQSECGIPQKCERAVPRWLIILDNAPTVVMFILGAVLLYVIWWLFSVIFLIYCILSIVMFWRLICPYCHHFDTRRCPCGYGMIASKLFKSRLGTGREFRKVFKRNIMIVFPCWLVPLCAGVYQLWHDFSWIVVALFLAFCIVGFIMIPAISKFVGCRGCELRDQCPWMA